MKTGDLLQTPHGPGTIHHFEVHPPLILRGAPAAHLDHIPEPLPEGSFVRVGVIGTSAPVGPVAYFSLDKVSANPTI